MNWLRANYERVTLLAAALFLIACASFIWRAAAGFNESFASSIAGGPPKPATPPAKATELEAAAQKLPHTPQWTFNSRSGLFVPEKHFIGPAGLPVTLETTEVHPPVPNEWLDQYGLPIADADVLTQDPDGDGFNNLEEWQGHTDPTDKNSHPPFVTKLKLKSFNREPFRLVFASRTGDTFGINSSDLKEPTQFLKMGETIRGTKFKIAKFTEKTEPNQYGTEMDVSELTIENTETKERLNLVKEKIMISPESVGTFVYQWGEPRELTIKKDQEFSLPPQTEIRYKLLDVQPNKAVIVDTKKPAERIEIAPLNP
ncbi:MAG: thrombospondin type 3 repeat-containing protein [Verrucomicrobiota bacterium]|nr:thrombospondin type 3 repeat-containing protein [Verrucomicrobiota bacterium]